MEKLQHNRFDPGYRLVQDFPIGMAFAAYGLENNVNCVQKDRWAQSYIIGPIETMSRIVFQIMGGLVLGTAAGLFFAGVLVSLGYLPRLSPSVSLLVFCIRVALGVALLVVVGIGLLQLRKWAALLLSVAALYPAFWSVRAAIYSPDPKPGDANWICFVYAAILIIPSILTARYWYILIWRRNREARIVTS